MPWTRAFSHLLGRSAEDQAQKYLNQRGLTLIEKNFHCRRGEIDLIMQDGDCLVFVEVKYRQQLSHGRPEEYFHQQKRRKVLAAIEQFLHQRGLNPDSVEQRIDLVAIHGNDIQWFKQV